MFGRKNPDLPHCSQIGLREGSAVVPGMTGCCRISGGSRGTMGSVQVTICSFSSLFYFFNPRTSSPLMFIAAVHSWPYVLTLSLLGNIRSLDSFVGENKRSFMTIQIPSFVHPETWLNADGPSTLFISATLVSSQRYLRGRFTRGDVSPVLPTEPKQTSSRPTRRYSDKNDALQRLVLAHSRSQHWPPIVTRAKHRPPTSTATLRSFTRMWSIRLDRVRRGTSRTIYETSYHAVGLLAAATNPP